MMRAMLAAACFAFAPPTRAADYPLVFTDSAALHQIGLDIGFGQDSKAFKNKCYAYGDGGYDMSMSDEFLARFTARGFTLQATCLGLVSETRYDPETGKRLPTYIVVDKQAIAENLAANPKAVEENTVDAGVTTGEMPLDLPDCFKNANPYSDCTFRYGRMSGKTLTAKQTKTYEQLGAAIDAVMAARIGKAGPPRTEAIFGSDEPYLAGFRKPDGGYLPGELQDVDEFLLRYSSASLWVTLASFKRGYGYALDADGGAGPSVSAATLKAAVDGMKKPQIDAEALRQALDGKAGDTARQ